MTMEKVINVKIESSLDGKIVKWILLEHLKLSKSIMKNLKKYDDGILLNGERVNVLRKVQDGDVLKLKIYEREESGIIPRNIPLDILYEDSEIIALNKPHSMPTHPSRNHVDDTLANALMYYLKEEKPTFHAITRLDRETSGVVLIAKNAYSAQRLSGDMMEKRIKKEYVAAVNGVPIKKEGEIRAPIRRREEGKIPRCVADNGKEAVTGYSVIKGNDKFSLIRLFPVTGRTHQLRVHMSYIGNPIYGDLMYGAPQMNERTRLHCAKITFFHPVSRQEMTVEAPLPDDILIVEDERE